MKTSGLEVLACPAVDLVRRSVQLDSLNRRDVSSP